MMVFYLKGLKGDPCWRERIPFYRQKGWLYKQRVRVCIPLGFVAHASGYKIMVGAHNTIDVTVEYQMHVGGRVAFFGNGRCRYLQILLMPRGM